MDARVCARPGCGNPLLPGRKLKDVCSYACRGQMRVEAIKGQTALRCSKNTKQNKALQTLKRQSVAGFSFVQINSCTYRLDRPSKLGGGWLMEVAWPAGKQQRWVARNGNRASDLLTLDQAKRAAVALVCERSKAEPHDWIAELNSIATAEVERVALANARKEWPRDLLGGSRRGTVIWIDREKRNAIFDAELAVPVVGDPLSGDDYPLEYYEDGFPKLPACLNRKAKRLLIEQAVA